MNYTTKLKRSISEHLEIFLGLDLRSLALFRIGLAILIIVDLIVRILDLRAHYTDFGVLPRNLAIEFFPNLWSLHLFSGVAFFQIILFLLSGIFAVALLIGYQTRLSTILSWIFLVSLQQRNPLINNSGDIEFHLLLFWGMFLPLGACYSVDSALNLASNKLPKRIVSGATIALTAQICFIYWFAWVLKSDPIWKVEGSAVYYALSLERYATPIAKYLLNFPELLKFLNFATLWIELLGPFFLFMPIFTQSFRLFAVISFICLHIGFRLGLTIGLFYLISSVAWLVFIPSFVWDKLGQKLKYNQWETVKIYVSNQNEFVKKSMYLLTKFLLIPQYILYYDNNLDEELSKQKKYYCIIDQETNQSFYGFGALVQLCYLSPLFLPIKLVNLSIICQPLSWLGKKIYRLLTKEGSFFASLIERLYFHNSLLRFSWINTIICLFLLVCVYNWNVAGVQQTNFAFPFFRNVFVGLALDQKWDMFAPSPSLDDGWYVIPGNLKDGTQIDLFNQGKDVRWEKPDLPSATYKNEHWRKYMENITNVNGTNYRLYYGKYLCRKWNEKLQEQKQLDNFKIYFMSEKTLPNYQPPKLEKIMLWEHFCFK